MEKTHMTKALAPVLYIPHGGGPLPLLGDPDHQQLVDFLRLIPSSLGEPSAIVVIALIGKRNRQPVPVGQRLS